ncbi:leucine-rich repeat-containing protein 18 [Protopterus annectens]|uniref:leucine-rich repeat-containing protein 18 n=1 Tax=Protopterus annectens TaxID=7888 RepID=UPI001CF9B0C2|nr:leucine-rich repeat-containing protein 18 [Protopterus annectens]XP_043912712.1 leucine-rich repeat-containing protein 18 [Protopterus annectens]XP_043912713.1 leucine-rich repeat-containing protein 18 [Protopterus annectens]
MPKGKKKGGPKGKKITLKIAKNSIKVTIDGKRRLTLSNMGITTFPKCILKLADVEELDLSRNMIKKIPETIEKFQNLRWLDIHSNQLEKLPETIGQLQNLLYLNLCNNKLNASSLPMEIGQLKNLRYLNLGMNNFETLPSCLAGLKELKELGLFDNKLTSLPDKIVKLPKLNKMNVMRNPFPRPEDDDKLIDKIKRTESLYLVHEQDLCKSCFKMCQEEREKLNKLKNTASSQRKSNYGSLATPNSTAKETQEEWR